MDETAKYCPFPLLVGYIGLEYLHRVHPPRTDVRSSAAPKLLVDICDDVNVLTVDL